jgi:16S rRNA (cytidine1402-2'-O)-methyltransferase
MSNEPSAPVLYIVATPIGNLEDITLRALRILKEVDLIAAEDTRRTIKLLNYYNIKTPLTSYFEHNKLTKGPALLRQIKEGKKVALVTDAGTPGISDPGYQLIRLALNDEIPVIPIPGPSALTAALSAAGLPTHEFLFIGFLPVKKGARRRALEALKDLPYTLIFYQSPYKLNRHLEDYLEVLGDRAVVLCRELTKIHEEFWRGTLAGARQAWGEKEIRGEITLVIAGAEKFSKYSET